jgi:hypothetical protein
MRAVPRTSHAVRRQHSNLISTHACSSHSLCPPTPHRQHSDQLCAKIDAIVAATSPAPSPITLAALHFAPNQIPPVAPGSFPNAPACAPAGAALHFPPVPFELFAHVRRQRDVAHSLLRSSLARMRRRRTMSPAPRAPADPAAQAPGSRRRSKSPLARACVSAPPAAAPTHAATLVAGPCKSRPARTPPRRSSFSSNCTVDEEATPARRSQRVAMLADRRRSVECTG